MIKSTLTPPTIDQATIDRYVAKGRRERSRYLAEMVRNLFSRPEPVERLAKADCAA